MAKLYSDEWRDNLSKAQKLAWVEGKYGEERNRKISASLKGRPKPKRTPEHAAKIAVKLTGRKASLSTRLKMSESHKREKHWRWTGKSPENRLIRQSIEYRLWRTAVFMRDNYTCKMCGARGCRLNADHIKPFSLYPELRFAIDNGRTLCVECHKQTPSYLNSYGRNQYV